MTRFLLAALLCWLRPDNSILSVDSADTNRLAWCVAQRYVPVECTPVVVTNSQTNITVNASYAAFTNDVAMLTGLGIGWTQQIREIKRQLQALDPLGTNTSLIALAAGLLTDVVTGDLITSGGCIQPQTSAFTNISTRVSTVWVPLASGQ